MGQLIYESTWATDSVESQLLRWVLKEARSSLGHRKAGDSGRDQQDPRQRLPCGELAGCGERGSWNGEGQVLVKLQSRGFLWEAESL